MSGRTHPLGTVAIGLVKRDIGLGDAQLQSIVHQLRRQGATVPVDQADHLQTSLRTKLQADLDSDPTIKPQRRDGLQRRLTVALDRPLEPALAWSLHQLRGSALRAHAAIQWRLAALAAVRGQTLAETTAEFQALRDRAPRGRQRRAPWEERATTWGLPQDPSTRYAFDQLRRSAGPRTPRRLVTDHPHAIPKFSGFLFGYDPMSCRLEVLQPDGSVAPFRLVPPDLASALSSGDSRLALTQLSSLARHRFRNQVGAESTGFALRCPNCDRATALAHVCPAAPPVLAGGQLVQVAHAGATLRTIAADDVAHLLAAGHVAELPVHITCSSPIDTEPAPPLPHPGPGVVDGIAIVALADRPQLTLDRIECSCMTFREARNCGHLTIAGQLLEAHLTPPADPAPAPADLTAYRAAAALNADKPTVAPDVSTFNYRDDPLRFAADCRAALTRRGDEHGGVPFLTATPAIYGYGENRPFGIEVEYSTGRLADPGHADDCLPGLNLGEVETSHYLAGHGWQHGYRQTHTNAAGEEASATEILNAHIGKALHDHGILNDPAIQNYGAAKDSGYSQTGWIFETDATVAGEIVSPILSDTPQTWRDLATICAQVTTQGAAAEGAGCHVHVAAADFATNAAAITSLLRLLLVAEDDLYRMASNPHTSSRIAQFCRPPQQPPALGFSAVTEALETSTHASMVSFTDIHPDDPQPSHLEFRLFDASLQPGRIQAQVKLALALTGYSAHHAISPLEPRNRLGAGTHRRKVLRSSGEWFDPVTTAPIRHLIDRLFRRDDDKRQIAALWAVSTYQDNPTPEMR
ncbi:amidoligase family protein [Kribbella sp. NPDC023972]|uniref:amidoligase family protein n=1 Tax=Kribbella sp. NPDC023972 TaxID=3154795 RepID=UPI0033FC89C9